MRRVWCGGYIDGENLRSDHDHDPSIESRAKLPEKGNHVPYFFDSRRT